MPKINLTVSHRLSQEEALKRVQGLLEDLRSQYSDQISDLREQWSNNICRFSFSAMGSSESGTLTVTPSSVELSGDLPWAASLFKGKIESAIKKQAETLLA